MTTQFTVYAAARVQGLVKGQPYVVYDIRFEASTGNTYFLVATEDGEFKWFTSANFKESQRQA